MEYADDLNSCGSIAEKVSYEIKGNKVVAHGASGLSSVFTIVDENTLSMDVPLTGALYYSRVGG